MSAREPGGSVSQPLGKDDINAIGVGRIADALGISRQAVRKWRRNDHVPEDRHDAVQQLLSNRQADVAEASVVAEVSPAAAVAPRTAKSETRDARPAAATTQPARQPLTVAPTLPPKLIEKDSKRAGAAVRMMIAARDVDQTRLVVDKAAAAADGLPPEPPVRGYRTRLAVLFALDFPILTMAFATVTQVSPIVAAGSAIALSLGLVLCAHAAGARLRRLVTHLPPWVADAAGLAVMLGLIAAVLAVATDLRLKGIEIDNQLLADAKASLFNGGQGGSSALPESLAWAIVRAAGLVTLLLTVFGMAWSYQLHGPQYAFAKAEAAYRRSLRRYARAVKRARMPGTAMAALAIMGLAPGTPAHAASCQGPVVLAFIDTTTAYDQTDRDQIMPALDTMVEAIPAGARLILRTVRQTPDASQHLLDTCRPASVSFSWTVQGVWQWLTTNPAERRQAEAVFQAAVRDAVLPQLREHGETGGTALVATLAEAMAMTPDIHALWLFSDLLESVALPTTALLSQPDRLPQATPRLPSLDGAIVHVAGIGRFHDTTRRPLSSAEFGALVDSWTGLFRNAGGVLRQVDDRHP